MNNPFMPKAPMNPTQSFEQAFNEFRRTFPGDPRQTINQKLASGEISQAQVNAAFQKARQMGFNI